MSEEFKYDIVGKTEVKSDEKFPEFFLSDTKEEAEKMYREFKRTIGILSENYARATGIDKWDLFGQAMFGLARAKRDFEANRSDNFKSFAIIKIKDALNEHVRSFSTTISIPMYLKKSKRHLSILKEMVSIEHFTMNELVKFMESADDKIKDKIRKIVEFLRRSADRASTPFEEYIERIELLPSYVDADMSRVEEHTHSETENRLQAVMMVEKLKQHMTDEEKKISSLVMEGMTYKEIGERLNGKSHTWVLNKLKAMKEKFIKLKINP